MDIVEVTKDNVAEVGFFCCMSKRKTEGYQRKFRWLQDRFDEGMRIKMLDLKQGGRGFVEYVPGEHAWRAVNAEGFMFIHCVWIVGQSRGKGYAIMLLNECIKDAKGSGMKGVVALTSERNWLLGKKLFLKHGFESVAEYPPFNLMVKKFDNDTSSPSFSGDFDDRLRKCGEGLTIFRSDQCPYLNNAVKVTLDAAKGFGIEIKVVELKTAEDVRRLAPSPYGVFSIVYDGKLVDYRFPDKNALAESLKTGKRAGEMATKKGESDSD
jgi:ribosomal protein S18 acetylase RimI-like enzyme